MKANLKINLKKNLKFNSIKKGGGVGSVLDTFGKAQSIFNLVIATIILIICIVVSILFGLNKIEPDPKSEISKNGMIGIIMGIGILIWVITYINYRLSMKYKGYAQVTGAFGAVNMTASLFDG